MNQPPSLIADLLQLLNVEHRYEFEERAGTIEFDSQVPRDEAECLALIDLLRTYPGALLGVSVFEVKRDGQSEFLLTTDESAARDRLRALHVRLLPIFDLAELIKTQFGGLASIARF